MIGITSFRLASFFVLSVAASSSVLAQYDFDARPENLDQVADLCKKLTFSSDQKKCLDVVRDGRSFSLTAARLCTKMTFSSSAAECMKAIANKAYLRAEVENCGKSALDSVKLECLQSSGKLNKYAPPASEIVEGPRDSSKQSLLRTLRRIERELRDQEIAQALVDLGQLIRRVENQSSYE